ncbi:MAG: hypothetical protein J6Y96_00015 [Mycoplasma sp.]|nr:hypothetical protein [Mycoplasma sp.]
MISNFSEKLVSLDKVIFNENPFHKCKLHEICKKLNINYETIENYKFNFILNFLNNDETIDFLCNFIHNDKYIVTTYSPLSSKEYKKIFLYFKKLLADFSEFIFSLIL